MEKMQKKTNYNRIIFISIILFILIIVGFFLFNNNFKSDKFWITKYGSQELKKLYSEYEVSKKNLNYAEKNNLSLYEFSSNERLLFYKYKDMLKNEIFRKYYGLILNSDNYKTKIPDYIYKEVNINQTDIINIEEIKKILTKLKLKFKKESDDDIIVLKKREYNYDLYKNIFFQDEKNIHLEVDNGLYLNKNEITEIKLMFEEFHRNKLKKNIIFYEVKAIPKSYPIKINKDSIEIKLLFQYKSEKLELVAQY